MPISYPYNRAENESKQLHQVIAQLRQVRKSSKEGEVDITAERNNLKTEVENLTGMYINMHISLSIYTYIYISMCI
jgi:hypothetical protein